MSQDVVCGGEYIPDPEPSSLCSHHITCFVYYEEIKREVNRIRIHECRCDERPKDKSEGSTLLTYTGLRGGLEHLKIETRLRDERFESVKGECVM